MNDRITAILVLGTFGLFAFSEAALPKWGLPAVVIVYLWGLLLILLMAGRSERGGRFVCGTPYLARSQKNQDTRTIVVTQAEMIELCGSTSPTEYLLAVLGGEGADSELMSQESTRLEDWIYNWVRVRDADETDCTIYFGTANIIGRP